LFEPEGRLEHALSTAVQFCSNILAGLGCPSAERQAIYHGKYQGSNFSNNFGSEQLLTVYYGQLYRELVNGNAASG
jgi:hypothetical protein